MGRAKLGWLLRGLIWPIFLTSAISVHELMDCHLKWPPHLHVCPQVLPQDTELPACELWLVLPSTGANYIDCQGMCTLHLQGEFVPCHNDGKT